MGNFMDGKGNATNKGREVLEGFCVMGVGLIGRGLIIWIVDGEYG